MSHRIPVQDYWLVVKIGLILTKFYLHVEVRNFHHAVWSHSLLQEGFYQQALTLHWCMGHHTQTMLYSNAVITWKLHYHIRPFVLQEGFYQQALTNILPWCMAHHFQTRLHSQAVLSKLWFQARDLGLTAVLAANPILDYIVTFNQKNR